MSGRFVRASSYRHVHGEQARTDAQFLEISTHGSGDGNMIAANHKFFAMPISGGGGKYVVHDMKKTGRIPRTVPSVQIHKGKVLDVAFAPHNYTLCASASEDCKIGFVNLPADGLTANINAAAEECLGFAIGHQKKVTTLKWHPTASNILASGSADGTVKVWDIETKEAIYSMACGDAIHQIAWKRDGSQLAVCHKGTPGNPHLRIYDPRVASDEKDCVSAVDFEGPKRATPFFTKQGYLITTGCTRSSQRRVHLYDLANMENGPLTTIDIDRASGVMMPHYDYDNSILYIGGKGDSTVKYFEIDTNKPYIHELTSFSDNVASKGICFLPKYALDTTKCEIARCLRVMRDSVIPVSFQVPRKSEMFQEDLFPDTASSKPALTKEQYFEGKNADPLLVSMAPGEGEEVAAAALSIKKSYSELEQELAAAVARIAELEAELAK